MRRLVGLVVAWARPRPWLALVVLASVAFLPPALQFVREGVPDRLNTGDAAALELGTLHAAHGSQLLGPYSRFRWSHPGPAFFYLSLPTYLAFHRHGTALNLFALMTNWAAVLAAVLVARKLGGDAFAFGAAACLGIYAMVGINFGLSDDWNPFTPILPLALLSLLSARLALGHVAVLPWFVAVASAIVQTHVGFVPVVGVLCAVPAVARAGSWLSRRRRPSPGGVRWLRPLLLSVATLAVVWALPVYEQATTRHGNLGSLLSFFTSGPPPELLADAQPAQHEWPEVWGLVTRQLVQAPMAVTRLFHLATQAPAGPTVITLALIAALAIVLGWSLRRREHVSTVLAAIALAEIGAALVAVRRISGSIEDYLLVWISIVGVVAALALAAWALARLAGDRRATWTCAGVAAVVLGVTLAATPPSGAVLRAVDPEAEDLARQIEHAVVTGHVPRPTVHVGAPDAWPATVAVVLSLYKHRVPVAVEPNFLFLMGRQFAASSAERPQLYVSMRDREPWVRKRRDQRAIAATASLFAYLEDPTYLDEHRVRGQIALIGSHAVDGDPARAVDGDVPPTGTKWNAPSSVVLRSTDSWLELVVPTGANGMFLSVDGNDVYAIRCVDTEGHTRQLETVTSGTFGMGVAMAFSDDLSTCPTVRIAPVSGDGLYAVGEVGFLTP